MLRSLHDPQRYTLGATDGDIGDVKDFYFDDATWVIRYLVVETGHWFASRKVLIAPLSIHHADWGAHRLALSITREQVKSSPDIDTDKPVSRQHEMDYLGYYGYPLYWGMGGMWAGGAMPYSMYASDNQPHHRGSQPLEPEDDLRLRSCKAVTGYHIHATDGEVGHVETLLVNEDTWAILYMVVNTSNGWGGHNVLIAPEWIEAISWEDEKVFVDLDREKVKTAPEYDPEVELSREHETMLYAHYGRSGYWAAQTRSEFPD